MCRDKDFTRDQDRIVLSLHRRFTVEFIAGRIARSPVAVQQRMFELGIRAKHQPEKAPERTHLSQIIKPLPEKQEYYLRGEIAESVILSLV
jgi:hypothetical protein